MSPITLDHAAVQSLTPWAWLSLLIAVAGAVWVAFDISRRPQSMAVMKWVWPLAALWGSVFGLALYGLAGRASPASTAMPGMGMTGMKMKGMKMKPGMAMQPGESMDMGPQRPFYLRVAAGTAHCGAGCSLADLVGGWWFFFFPWVLAGSAVMGEWTGEYLLALAFGVAFQYAAIQPMLHLPTGAAIARAFRVDVLSLTAWQLGMYGFMGWVLFLAIGRVAPTSPVFWLLMQGAMIAGFFCSYVVNWWLIRSGIKPAM
ncbi:MAG: DUF4396 domain-containing protein [Burkholderiaceae bacterium]